VTGPTISDATTATAASTTDLNSDAVAGTGSFYTSNLLPDTATSMTPENPVTEIAPATAVVPPQNIPTNQTDPAPGQTSGNAAAVRRDRQWVCNPTVLVNETSILEMDISIFHVRNVQASFMEIVVTMGQEVFLVRLTADFTTCEEEEDWTQFAVSNQQSIECRCNRPHATSGTGTCRGCNAVEALITANQYERLIMYDLHNIVNHVEDCCWSVRSAEDDVTVLVYRTQRNHNHSCSGMLDSCGNNKHCVHVAALKEAMHIQKPFLELELESYKEGDKSSLPIKYCPIKQDFVPVQEDTLPSRHSHYQLFIEDPHVKKVNKYENNFLLGRPEEFASWTSANLLGQIPKLIGNAQPCCGSENSVWCQCHVADTNGFAIVELEMCLSCRVPKTKADQHYQIFLDQMKEKAPSEYCCFTITVATVRHFLFTLEESSNVLKLYRNMLTQLREYLRPDSKYRQTNVLNHFFFKYDLLRNAIYKCAALMGIARQLRETSCLHHHEGVLDAVTIDGTFCGVKSKQLRKFG